VKSSRERGKIYDNIRPTHDRIINKPRDDKYVDINTIINKLFGQRKTIYQKRKYRLILFFSSNTKVFFIS
jgi:hypothetical protein